MDGINVHLRLDEAGQEYVYSLNEQIRSVTRSLIFLSPTSDAIPHITLLAGRLSARQDSMEAIYTDLASTAHSIVAAASLQSVHIVTPNVSAATRGYVLSEVTSDVSIDEIQRELRQIFVPGTIAHPSLGSSPHVTIALVDKIERGLLRVLKEGRKEVACGISSIAVSYSGPHGTCIGTILEEKIKRDLAYSQSGGSCAAMMRPTITRRRIVPVRRVSSWLWCWPDAVSLSQGSARSGRRTPRRRRARVRACWQSASPIVR